MLLRENCASSTCADRASVIPVVLPGVPPVNDPASGANADGFPPDGRGTCAIVGLLTLRVGTPIGEALELASSMTVSACHTVRRIAMHEQTEQNDDLWCIVHLLQTTAGILNDAIKAIDDRSVKTPNRSNRNPFDRMAADAQNVPA